MTKRRKETFICIEAIVTANDRASGLFRMKHVPTKENVMADAIGEILEDWKPFIHTNNL